MSVGSGLSVMYQEYYNTPIAQQQHHYHTMNNLKAQSNPTLLHYSLKKLSPTQSTTTTWNFTWLVFMNEKWVPFDSLNQTKLEQTLTVGGSFVDIQDSHFPDVKRVRVFPKNNYLSYLGVKYRLSRIMQPDAYLDHMSVAEARKVASSPPNNRIMISLLEKSNNRASLQQQQSSPPWEV